MEQDLLGAILQDRSVWEQVVKLGKEDGSSFSDLGKVIWKHASNYYKKDKEAKSVSRDVLLTSVKASTNEKTYEVIEDVIKALPAASVPNIKDAYAQQRRDIVGQLLSSALLGKDNKKTQDLLAAYAELSRGNLHKQTALDLYPADDVRCLFDVINREGLMRIRPLYLNEKIDGGACRGDHIVISGRVENGKTLIAINMTRGLVKDGHKGLYIGNEDGPRRMRPRFLSCLSGMSKNEVRTNPDKALDRAKENGWDNLTFASQEPGGSLEQVHEALEGGDYAFVVLDQLRNVGASDDESKVGKLEEVALGARDLAKKYDVLVISVTQSNNGPQHINKLLPDMGDVADSKVGIPGQADLLIMIGSNEEFRDKNQLMINVVKNKLSGWHGYFPVVVDPQISKVIRSLAS